MTAKILVVEDNPDNMRLIEYLLTAGGYTPLLATNGLSGVQVAAEERPNLILLDIHMPDMDGYEAVAEIRKQTTMEQPAIVAVTAFAMVGDRGRMLAAGFDDCITKPINPETFVVDIERFLQLAMRVG
jgi:CheY-like chemotaxis protein